MGCYKGCVWVSLGSVGHIELSEGFFGLTVPACSNGKSPTTRWINELPDHLKRS